MENYQVAIIGAGPSGIECALRSVDLGLKVAIIDRDQSGGTCTCMGAIPSKVLVRHAEIAYFLRNKAHFFGFGFEKLTLDYTRAIQHSRQVATRLSQLAFNQLTERGVVYYGGAALLPSRDRVQVIDDDEHSIEIRSANIVIATGADPLHINEIPIDGKQVMTYKHAILQEHLPSSVLIIGGGALGVEFATIWNSFGVEVTIVEILPRLVPYEDEDISAVLETTLAARGIRIITGTRVTAINKSIGNVQVEMSTAKGNQTQLVEQVLESASFKHNSAGMGLEELGVALGENGVILTNERLQTNIRGIWAIGDVNGKLMLASAGRAMGIAVAEMIAGVNRPPLDYLMMPKVTFCQPQIASFGMTEAQARQNGYEVKVGKNHFETNGMGMISGTKAGWAKVVVDGKTRRILGAHLIGEGVAELLPELNLAQAYGHSASEIVRNVHAYPTLGEVVAEAVRIAGS